MLGFSQPRDLSDDGGVWQPLTPGERIELAGILLTLLACFLAFAAVAYFIKEQL